MERKYDPLKIYLQGLPVEQTEITLTFERIEEILSDRLPPSAYRLPDWWENHTRGRHVPAYAWLEAGWKKDTLYLSEGRVRFIRKS